jgi:ankyrin repeat protein
MFPNLQDALPLPPRPNVEQYKTLAKDLVKACKAGTISAWAEASAGRRWAGRVSDFAAGKMTGERKCALADAQFVIARLYGFLTWKTFASHVESLANATSQTAQFEEAADAIVSGDIAALTRLLDEDRDLIHARSTREHGATLLHYVSANGVENYRQKTPANIVEIAELLMTAGAEIDATWSVYGGECTTLLLAATSVHPEDAGVQIPLLERLLDRGAHMNTSIVNACLANGRRLAAAFLAERGAHLDFPDAAGLGRIDLAQRFLERGVSKKEMRQAFGWACEYGGVEMVRLLMNSGADLEPRAGTQSPLHMAVIGGNLEVVKYLLQFHPPLEVKNEYGGTVLGQALWSAAHGGDPEVYGAIIDTLIAAGAQVRPFHVPVNSRIDEHLRRYGSEPEPSWHWFGEGE